jgi:hypothetical protein
MATKCENKSCTWYDGCPNGSYPEEFCGWSFGTQECNGMMPKGCMRIEDERPASLAEHLRKAGANFAFKPIAPLPDTPLPVFNAVECDRADGTGCGAIWLEKDGKAREFCPGCNRRASSGNMIVNSENCPDMRGLDSEYVMVVWAEEVWPKDSQTEV